MSKIIILVSLLYNEVFGVVDAYHSRIGPKGQVTVPKTLREKYHLKEGEDVVILPGEDGLLLKHATRSPLRGRLKGRLDTRGIEDDIKELRKQWRL
jgi:AbrB family looped-hinge helix DNA binding protein